MKNSLPTGISYLNNFSNITKLVEELVNFAGTTTNAARIFRESGYPVSHAACILFYDTPSANDSLRKADLNLVYLLGLPRMVEIIGAEGLANPAAVKQYQEFLKDPIDWQLKRNLVIPKASAEKATSRGTKMVPLTSDEAINRGAPRGKVEKDKIEYWAPENG